MCVCGVQRRKEKRHNEHSVHHHDRVNYDNYHEYQNLSRCKPDDAHFGHLRSSKNHHIFTYRESWTCVRPKLGALHNMTRCLTNLCSGHCILCGYPGEMSFFFLFFSFSSKVVPFDDFADQSTQSDNLDKQSSLSALPVPVLGAANAVFI